MELQQLRYFHAIAQSGSVTEAARKLHIAQPALSQSMRRLEKDLGVQLLQRAGRGIELTEIGKLVAPHVSAILHDIDGLKDLANSSIEKRSKTVLAQIKSAEDTTLGVIADYRILFPEAQFSLIQADSNRQADFLAYARAARPNDSQRFTIDGWTQEFVEEICLAVPKSVPMPNSISPEELDGLPLLSASPIHSFRTICDSICCQYGITPNIQFEANTFEHVARMVEQGMGMALWPIFSWQEIDQSRVKLVVIEGASFSQVIVWQIPHPESASPEAKRFFEYSCDHTRAFHAAMEGSGPFDLAAIHKAAIECGRIWGGRSRFD